MTDSLLQSLSGLFQKSTDIVGRLSWDAWRTETAMRAARVSLYRDYMEGDHRAKLTTEMKQLLRLENSSALEDVSPFNLNHMDNIVQKLVDRLEVTGIEADTDAGTQWIQAALDANRFDGLQLTVHDAACGDGDGFLMVGFDEAGDMPIFTQEDAYDGVDGVILVYGSDGRTPAVAIKSWRENVSDAGRLSERARVNVYYPDRVEKYVTGTGGALSRHLDNEGDVWPYPWKDASGQSLGVPIIHFPNGGRGTYGRSEIADAIPVQDSINRVMTSMVMSAELTAFQIRIAKGFRPPAGLSPGMWVPIVPRETVNGVVQDATRITPETAAWLGSVGVDTLEAADLSPYLEVQRFLIDQMYEITRTPRAASADSSASGESLRQREIDLIGKAKRAAVSFGNAWESAVKFAAKLQNVYGKKKAPVFTRVTAKWASAQIRNVKEDVANALSIADHVDSYTLLEALAPSFGWDTSKLLEILETKKSEQTDRLSALGVGGALPSFGATPLDGGNTDNGNDALAANIVSVPATVSGNVAA